MCIFPIMTIKMLLKLVNICSIKVYFKITILDMYLKTTFQGIARISKSFQ